jgi:hypothetical protein
MESGMISISSCWPRRRRQLTVARASLMSDKLSRVKCWKRPPRYPVNVLVEFEMPGPSKNAGFSTGWKKAAAILAVIVAMLLLLTPSVLLWRRAPSNLGLAVIAITFFGMVFIFIRKYRKYLNDKF